MFNVRLREAFASINFAPAEGTSSLAGDRLRRYERRPFEYIVVPPRFPLSGAAETAPEVLVFVFDIDWVRDALSQIVAGAPDRVNPLVVIGDPSPLVTGLAKKLRAHLSTPALSRTYLRSLSSVLLIEMCLPMASQAKGKRSSPLRSDKVNILLKYIEANLDANLGVRQLAQLVGASTDQLSRAFKRSVGESPHNYVLQRRTDAARRLLINSDAALSEIAYATGFSSQSHMTTAFKKLLGTTPGAIRRGR